MFDKATARKFSRAKTPRRKVTGQAPSSRTNVRDLKKISPFGRNDKAPPWRALRLCASHLFSDSAKQNSTENFIYVWLVFLVHFHCAGSGMERYRGFAQRVEVLNDVFVGHILTHVVALSMN